MEKKKKKKETIEEFLNEYSGTEDEIDWVKLAEESIKPDDVEAVAS